MEPGSEPAVPRQRWRLVLARERAERSPIEPSTGRTRTTGRDRADAWDAALAASGLPGFCPTGRDRPRVAFAAPLPDRIAGERELADIVLTTREPAWRVRAALIDRMPDDWRLIDLFDVWLGEPALAGQVVAADYRIELEGANEGVVSTAADVLLAAETLPRDRIKGGSTVRYDLRPLLADIRVIDPGPPVVVRVRTRFHPELGTGRPEEVVGALAVAADVDLVAATVVRERLILAYDLRSGDPG